MTKKDIHFCATCIHFQSARTDIGIRTVCSRLGYDTKPNYKFNCWQPKEHVLTRNAKPMKHVKGGTLHE